MRVLVAILCALALPFAAEAQTPGPVPHVGYLDFGSPASGAVNLDAFRQGLRDLGWVEGRNIVLEVRFADGKPARLPELAAELVGLHVDLIFASSAPAALAAKHATSTIPIVIGFVADPVGSGVVASLAHPGGNITGWTHLGFELRGKYLELLKEAIPSATRMGALLNPANPVHVASVKVLEGAAQALGVQLTVVEAQDVNGIEAAFSTLAQQRAEALAVPPDGFFLAEAARIVSLAARNRLPTLWGVKAPVKAGGLMAYGVNFPSMYRRGAYFVDKILKGARPADLPVEQPTKFELVINLRTAKALGVTIPQSMLLRADEVIR
jgi:putative ABC transport system substrate-binding protein